MLFRLEDFQGTIKIDGIDILNLPVQLLRSKISMISQNPMVFSGSVRHNLDPSHFFSDEKIYKIIQEVKPPC
jgi:ATP-binding cassette, subfamily C (CFTR/MRP), member 4